MYIDIDQYSATAMILVMRFGEQHLSIGTAFAVLHDEETFLITNWHNVTGRNPLTKTHLSDNAAEPDNLLVFLPVRDQLGTWASQDIPLYRAEGTPVWYEHPTHREKVDVVAVPLRCREGLTVYPINQMPTFDRMSVLVGQDAFILGFPFGLLLTSGFPVWKRASIATETDINIEGLPKFMVDTASRPGMSGSPVVRREYGQCYTNDGALAVTGGAVTKFLGIYSGRIGAEDELKAQLGIVWRASVIDEILAGRIKGEAR